MARGSTLLKLLDDLRAECRLSLNPAHNAQVRETQVKTLQRVQDWLYEDFAWPHLRVERRVLVQTGQRYYNLPDDIALERIAHIEIRDGDRWLSVEAGIEPDQYVDRDSDTGVQDWPVRRWRIWEDDKIELWPVPSQDGSADTLDGTLKFVGVRNLKRLVDDADVCDLDDRLIVLYAAAEMLGAAGAKDAKLKLDQAQRRYESLRGDLVPRRRFRMFSGSDRRRELRGPPTVHYRIVPGGGS